MNGTSICLRTAVQFTRCDVRNRCKVYTYVLVQQSVSANSIVATCGRVYVVDHPELCTCMPHWLHIHLTQSRCVHYR